MSTEGGSHVGASPTEDTFNILVATDTHLGYAENNPIRGQDSFVTFEEVLQLAVTNEVDFVLLGGDLFHESRPSPYCINKCLELLRKYCLGDKPVSIEFLSDQSCNFQFQKVPIVNYEDPNLNIGMPVFSIHGNHDDPSGHKQISALDIVSSTGLINYFGRWNTLSTVEIRPILLQKGETKLALYGLSHIKDERLGRLFRDKNVTMKKPEGDDWFNMFVLHQNRAARGVKNFIPESALPKFLDLVIWGHEHDCRVEAEQAANGVYICQPGSSVATSLAAGESYPKKVALLQVHQKEFKIIPLPLKTVRPFLLDELVLENPSSKSYCLEKPADQAVEQVKQKIDEMIKEAASRHQDPEKQPPLPLIRLKVFYHDERQQFNAVRIGMQYTGRVANPDDLIKLNSLIAKERKKKSRLNLDEDEFEQFVNVGEWATSVEDVVLKYFEDDKHKDAMSVLSAKGLTEAVSRFVKYGDGEAISMVIDKQYKSTVKQIIDMDPSIEQIEETIETLRKHRLNNDRENNAVLNNIADDDNCNGNNAEVKVENVPMDDIQSYIISDEDDDLPATTSKAKSKTTRGRGQARGSRTRARGRGSNTSKRGKQNSSYSTLLDEFLN